MMTSVDDYGSTHTSLKFEKKESVTSMNDYGSIHTSQNPKEKKKEKETKYGRLWFNPYWSKIPIKQTSIRTYKRQMIKSKQITQ